MKGENITFEKVYILQANDNTQMIYLSERLDNLKNKTGFWNHITYVTFEEGREVPSAIVINITNNEFLSFFLIKGKVVE